MVRSLTPPPSSSRASSSHSDHRSPLHTRAWFENRAANHLQFPAKHPLRGRGSHPRGRQTQNPTRFPVFYQDQQLTTKRRGISKKSRGYRCQRRRLTDAELTHYNKRNAAILWSMHHQRRHTGAVLKGGAWFGAVFALIYQSHVPTRTWNKGGFCVRNGKRKLWKMMEEE